jgi:hypothetical protein
MTLLPPLLPPFLPTAMLALSGESAANVEYSIDHRQGVQGITVPLRGDVGTALAGIAAAARLPGTWLSTVQRLIAAMLPNAILLRIDTDGRRIGALTAYLRFPQEPAAPALQALLGATSRLQVRPDTLAALAQALGCPGARGIGIRTSAEGDQRLAVYFRVERDVHGFGAAALQQLAGALGWPDDACAPIARDLRALHPGGSVGVIGVDIADDGDIAALKCDPANVPLARALPFLQQQGAGPERIEACLSLCRALRARTLSYVGVKYDRSGLAGWRLYFSYRPHGAARNGQPALLIDTPGIAALRMPHY